MPLRAVLLVLLLAAGAARAEAPAADGGDAVANELRSARDYLRDMRVTVELAQKGEYGKLTSAERKTLARSYARLGALLDGHDTPAELPLEERIALYNAQEAIVAIVERHPRDTMICRRKKSTGTRIPSTECLTIAQREARARASREAMDRLAKPNPCVSGQNC